jgi:quercetin dioxygenase-like cupin family protein
VELNGFVSKGVDMADNNDHGHDEKGGHPELGHNRVFSMMGHNSLSDAENQAKWTGWTKKRTFVRALEGKYSDMTKELYSQPRVYSPVTDMEWHGGPAAYHKSVVSPQATPITQAIEIHLDVYGPGGRSAKHGHMNSACFYILKGKGHEIHDGNRHDWEAGDAVVVENACVHEHCNTESDEEAHVLVFKAKPLFLFMHLMFQKMVQFPPKELPPEHGDWEAPKGVAF